MNEEPKPQSDERGAEPPAEGEEEGGPKGDPATDEEALSHSQQEQHPPDDD
jgi:hypothetical protein